MAQINQFLDLSKVVVSSLFKWESLTPSAQGKGVFNLSGAFVLIDNDTENQIMLISVLQQMNGSSPSSETILQHWL